MFDSHDYSSNNPRFWVPRGESTPMKDRSFFPKAFCFITCVE
jgi:hypothetical protein